MVQIKIYSNVFNNASINVKPEGGTLGICGAFDLYCLLHPQEFDLDSESQGGDICFFCTKEWDQVTSSHVLVCVPPLISSL